MRPWQNFAGPFRRNMGISLGQVVWKCFSVDSKQVLSPRPNVAVQKQNTWVGRNKTFCARQQKLWKKLLEKVIILGLPSLTCLQKWIFLRIPKRHLAISRLPMSCELVGSKGLNLSSRSATRRIFCSQLRRIWRSFQARNPMQWSTSSAFGREVPIWLNEDLTWSGTWAFWRLSARCLVTGSLNSIKLRRMSRPSSIWCSLPTSCLNMHVPTCPYFAAQQHELFVHNVWSKEV